MSLMTRAHWREDAACAPHRTTLPPTAWDAPLPRQPLTDDHIAAVNVCKECPVIDSCANEYLAQLRDSRYSPTGIWAAEIFRSA